MADQLDPDAEVAGIVAVAGVVLELLGALLQEPGQLRPQRRGRQRRLHLPHAPSKQRIDPSSNMHREGGEGEAIRSGRERERVPEPWAEGVRAGIGADVAHHRRQEVFLLVAAAAAAVLLGGRRHGRGGGLERRPAGRGEQHREGGFFRV